MKRLRRLFGDANPPDHGRASTATASEDVQPDQPTTEDQPSCGPECWLKEFLAYPDPPEDPIVPSSACAPASDQERQDVSVQLYRPIHAYQTRIIKLLPASLDDHVSCELLTADLIALPGVGISSTGDMVQYDCLSYSWGYPVFSHRVVCNGLSVPVIASLYEALRYLRFQDQPRYLWIDAFCINQFDAAEKSRQVQNMLLVYQKCDSVRAWLGMPQGQDRMATRFLRKMYHSDRPTIKYSRHFHDADCAARYATVCADLSSFFSANFWSRTWIRQEVFASRVLTFHSGPDSYDYSDILAMEIWQSLWPREQEAPMLEAQQPPNQDCLELMRLSRIPLRAWIKQGTIFDEPTRRLVHTGAWMEGLMAGTRFGTSDPRDKVYGVVGMLEEQSKVLDREALPSEEAPRESFLPRVDYSKSQSTVYQEIVRFLINRDNNLLPLCVFRDRTSTTHSEPSWVLSLQQDTRSWYVASHLTSEGSGLSNTIEIMEAMLQYSVIGYYGRADQVNAEATGTLECSGYRIGNITTSHSNAHRVAAKDVPLSRSISTSPPSLPTRISPHSFISSYAELETEAKYKVAEIEWSVSTSMVNESTREDINPHSHNLDDSNEPSPEDLTALVSQAARDGDQLVLLNGSPLPMVLRPESHGDAPVHRFLGPACWLWNSDNPEVNKMNLNAPGYTETARMYQYAQRHLTRESFCLV